jgi:hypothetical protein
MQTSGEVRETNGQWLIHWEGHDFPVSKEDAEGLRVQTTVRVATEDLLDSPLDWAVATVLGYAPTLQGQTVGGKLIEGGIVTPSYYNCYVVAHYVPRKRYGEFRPSADPRQSSPVIDEYRISTEIAGDGWAALVNECFDVRTWAKSVKAKTRVAAALRALVQARAGNEIDVPVELVEPKARLKALRESAVV